MKKKIVALGLTVCMILSASGTVFGVTGMSGELAAAVKAAKAIITIPDAYTEFDYYTYEEQNGEGKTELYWELLWYDKDYNGEISVTLSQNYQLIILATIIIIKNGVNCHRFPTVKLKKLLRHF